MTASAIRDSLESGTRWSTRTPSRRPGTGPEVGHGGREVVNAVQRLDDDALHPEVVTPDLLDELGVVLAFHPDAAGLGHLGALARHPDGARRRPAGTAAARRRPRAPAASAGSAVPPAGSRSRGGRTGTCRGGPPGPPRACRRTSPPGSRRPPSRTATSSRTMPALHRDLRQAGSWRGRTGPGGPSSGTTSVPRFFALGCMRRTAGCARKRRPARERPTPGANPMLTTRRLILDWLALRHVEC